MTMVQQESLEDVLKTSKNFWEMPMTKTATRSVLQEKVFLEI